MQYEKCLIQAPISTTNALLSLDKAVKIQEIAEPLYKALEIWEIAEFSYKTLEILEAKYEDIVENFHSD